MRVFFVETGGGVGGSVISLYYLIQGLMKSGIEPVVSFPTPHAWSPRFEALGATVRHERPTPPGSAASTQASGRRPWTESAAYRALHFYRTHWRDHKTARDRWARVIRDVAPDLVYTNNDLPLNFDVVEAADLLGIPVVCHLRGFQPIRLPHRRYAAKIRAGIAISEIVKRHYLKAGFDSEHIHRVYNGIDLADYPWKEPRHDISPGGGNILFLGRLTGWKGGPVLLEAISRLETTHPNLTLTVAGDGPARDDWVAEVARRGLTEKVRFAGFVEDIVPLLHAADLLVHSSVEPEPFGRVLIEGMAAGTPVLASDLGATREIIEDQVTGLLVPAGNAEALSQHISRCLSSGPKRADMARAARKQVEERFSVDRMVAGVLDVLDRVVPGGIAGHGVTSDAGSSVTHRPDASSREAAR